MNRRTFPVIVVQRMRLLSAYVFATIAAVTTTIVFCSPVRAWDSTTSLRAEFDPTNPCRTGQTILLTATVAPISGGGTPTGKVAFKVPGDSKTLGVVDLVNGVAVYRANHFVGNGTITLFANYLGDANFTPSMSPAASITLSNGPRLQVNTYKADSQRNSSVAALSGGGYVVVWESTGQNLRFNTDVFAQIYNVAGTPLGGEFQVNTQVAGQQLVTSVTGLADGGFVVVWHSQDQDGSGYGIYGQRYSASGLPRGREFRVNITTSANQMGPGIAAFPDGGFVVVWTTEFPLRSGYDIMAQRYAATGARIGGELKVAEKLEASLSERYPKVGALADGGFVVAWASGQVLSTVVSAQRYSSTNLAVGGRITVATGKYYQGVGSPNVLGLKDGGFVITWSDFAPPQYPRSGPHTFGQRFTVTGQRAGTPFHVTGWTVGQAATALSDGGFVVTWRLDQNNPLLFCPDIEGIFGQRYDRFAMPVGKAFVVAGRRAIDARAPSVAGLLNGGFVVTWTDREVDWFTDDNGIFSRRF